MTTLSDKPRGGPLPFAFGILFGVAATYLFGTDEGRKIVKKVLDSIPENYKNPLSSVSRLGGPPSTPIIQPEETQHHAILESPPPPSPSVHPVRPEPFKPTL